MSRSVPKLMSLAAALAALAGASAIVSDPAEAKTTEPPNVQPSEVAKASGLNPNTIVGVGEDFLGFIVTKASDGTMMAAHTSHYSHQSHASHSSHYSSSR